MNLNLDERYCLQGYKCLNPCKKVITMISDLPHDVSVVIGILIALSINNWNENRKERLTRKNHTEGLTV